MGAARVTEKIVELEAAGGADTLVVWDAPSGEAFKNMSVSVSSRGANTPAGNINWTLYNGGRFSDGKAYEVGSTYMEGNVISSGSITDLGIAEEVYTDTKKYPPNIPNVTKSVGGNIVDMYPGGYPIALKLVNLKALKVILVVTFISETVSDKV